MCYRITVKAFIQYNQNPYVWKSCPVYLFCCSNPSHWVFFPLAPTCSSLISHISCCSCRISHFSKNPDPFSWRIKLEIKPWVLVMFLVIEMSLLLGPLSWQNREIYVLLKNKLRPIKLFTSLFEQKLIPVSQCWIWGVRSAPQAGAPERHLTEVVRSQVRKLPIDYSLKPGWPFVIICPWCFNFLTFRHLQAYILLCLQRLPWSWSHHCLMASLCN